MATSAFGEVVKAPGTTFRTVTRREVTIAYNRAAVDALYAGVVDGVEEMLEQVRDDYAANAPRDPETAAERGVPMMADMGRVAVYAAGKLVAGTGERTAAGNKPKGAATPADQVVGFVMVDSPIAHFAELGTIHEVARPTLLPSFNRHIQDASKCILPSISRRIAAVPK
jgi:hypothetical protein